MKAVVYALFAGLVALSGAVALQFSQAAAAREDARAQVCVRMSALDNTLVSIIKTGERNAPKLAYYRAHPDELRLVIQQDEKAVHALTPPAFCH